MSRDVIVQLVYSCFFSFLFVFHSLHTLDKNDITQGVTAIQQHFYPPSDKVLNESGALIGEF